MIYYFYQAGALPVLGGIYAGVAVEVDEAHTQVLRVSPLGQVRVIDAASSPPSLPSPDLSVAEDIAPVTEENIASPEIKES